MSPAPACPVLCLGRRLCRHLDSAGCRWRPAHRRRAGTAARSPLEGREVAITGVVTQLLDDGRSGWFVQDGGDGDAATSDGLLVVATSAAGARCAGAGRSRARPGPRGRTRRRQRRDHHRARRQRHHPARPRRAGRGHGDPRLARGLGTLRGHAPAHRRAADDQRHRHARTFRRTRRQFRRPPVHADRDRRARPAAQRVAADNARRTLLLDDARTEPGPCQRLVPAGARHAPAAPCATSAACSTSTTARGACSWMPRCNRTPPRVRQRRALPAISASPASTSKTCSTATAAAVASRPRAARARLPSCKLQVDKLVATLHALDPDIAALMELENDGYGRESSLAQLVTRARPGLALRRCGRGSRTGRDPGRTGLSGVAGRHGGRTGDAGGRAIRQPQPGAARAGVQTAAGRRPTMARCSSWSPTISSPRAARKRPAPISTSTTARPAGMPCAPRRRGGWTPGSTDPTRSGSDLCADRRRSECLRTGRPAAGAARFRLDRCAKSSQRRRSLQLRLRFPGRTPRPRAAQSGAGRTLVRRRRMACQRRRTGQQRLSRRRHRALGQFRPRPAAARFQPARRALRFAACGSRHGAEA